MSTWSGSRSPAESYVCRFYFTVACGNMVLKKNAVNIDTLSHNVHCVRLVFSQKEYGLEEKKNAYRVIITVLRAHRGYASFNFTLYSPSPPVCSVPLPLSLTFSLSR